MRPKPLRPGSATREYLAGLGIVALAIAFCLPFRSRLTTLDVAMLLLLASVIVAARYRRAAALMAVLLAIAGFDFLFVPPYYTFNVHDTAYLLSFAVMLAVALILSHLTARIREQAGEAAEREERTAALYAFSRELAPVQHLADLQRVTEQHLGRAVSGEALVAITEPSTIVDGAPSWPGAPIFQSVDARVAATWAWQHGQPAGLGTPHCAESEAMMFPLLAGGRPLGVAAVWRSTRGDPFSVAECGLLARLVDLASAAFERLRLTEEHARAQVEVEAERLRIALLSSLSHDLRTPLASIEGAASSLVANPDLRPEVQADLAETIQEESRRMTRLIGNLLDMIRVETGTLAVQKEWQPLEEALGVALIRLEGRLSEHPVDTRLPADLPLVPIDELLVEQVFINLLENAAKHTPPGTPITISAWKEDGAVLVEVADQGPGLPSGAEETVFRKFYRAGGEDGREGAGLGLTICRGIIAAHGGRIWAEPRPRGAAFRFSLPLTGPPIPPMPNEPGPG